jgi:hypothetical protein
VGERNEGILGKWEVLEAGGSVSHEIGTQGRGGGFTAKARRSRRGAKVFLKGNAEVRRSPRKTRSRRRE